MKRRMIAQDIVSEGKFLRMSLTAQALYMHLVANADDDGCVDAYTITRLIGAKEDDLVLLKEREYITVLDPTEYILWITGWQDFNWIDSRYKEDSKYLPLLRSKIEGLQIVESTKQEYNKRRYAKRKMEKDLELQVGESSAHVQHMGSTGETTGSTLLRKGKVRIGEVSKDITISKDIVPTSAGYLKWNEAFKESLGFTITKEPKKNENAIKAIITDHSKEELHKVLAYLHWLKTTKKKSERPFIFQHLTSFIKIRQFWDKIQAEMTDDSFQETKQTQEYADFFNR